jgi:excinuclease ABC subunit C
MLKDDKTYPWICIKNEDFPRIFLTEPKLKTVPNIMDLMQSTSCKDFLDTIKHIYKFRTCNLNLLRVKLMKENIKSVWNITSKTVKVLVKDLKEGRL